MYVLPGMLASLLYTLPFGEVRHFGPLLTELDCVRDQLMVNDYSVNMASLEEVFMALGRQAEETAGEAGGTPDFREVAQEVGTGPRWAVSSVEAAACVVRLRMLLTFTNRQTPTSGEASVNGYDTATDVETVRRQRLRATARPGSFRPCNNARKGQDVLDEEARVAASPDQRTIFTAIVLPVFFHSPPLPCPCRPMG